jgi:ribosomal protein RSM22 (predicted rRNA methylase)
LSEIAGGIPRYAAYRNLFNKSRFGFGEHSGIVLLGPDICEMKKYPVSKESYSEQGEHAEYNDFRFSCFHKIHSNQQNIFDTGFVFTLYIGKYAFGV